jgi:uncharacterized surface protein with fasciclin (FAS1) repeats
MIPSTTHSIPMSKFNVKEAVAALTLCASCTAAGAADIVDTMAHASSFKTFCAALQSSGLAHTLKYPGPYTVFAPSDEAISRLPKGRWDALLKDKARLADVLAHHVIKGRLVVAEVKPGDMPTLEGDPVHLESDNGMVSVDSAKITQSDIEADNGIIHEIDALLLPEADK